MEDLQKCTTEECLIKVANDLSKKLLLKNSELASQLDLTSKKIEEKKIIVDVAKEAGVNFSDCQTMDPDTASLDLLRSCAKLAKDSRIQKYIPEEKLTASAIHVDKTIELRAALSKKEISCGDGTLN